MGAAQTDVSHEAVKETIDFSDDSEVDRIERYLQALAIGTRPNPLIMLDLIKVAETESKNSKIPTIIIHTLGSMAYRYAHLPEHNYSSSVVEKVFDYLNSSISSCNNNIPCYVNYLNGFSNLRSVETIDLLFGFANHTDRSISIAAMKALRRFPASAWKSKHIEAFEDIFFQTEHRFDSSARTLALDIILESKLTGAKLNKLFEHLKSNDRSFEVKKYLFEKLMMLSSEDAELNQQIEQIIRSNRTLNNYHILGQRGLTTALSRKYSIRSPFNGTLTSIQEIFGGILKRGVVDLSIDSESDKYSYFTVISIIS